MVGPSATTWLRLLPLLLSGWLCGCGAVPTVVLSGGKARLFKGGNPLVFSGAVSAVRGSAAAGDLVDVVDGSGSLVGWGVYNPLSQYRVRILAHAPSDSDHRDISALIHTRLAAAARRRATCALPSDKDTAYRLCNSEGDRLSGLTVDVFDGIAVVISSAIWLERHRDVITDALLELDGITSVVWRRAEARLKMDGWPVDGMDAGEVQDAGEETGPDTRLILESGLKYEVNPWLGQKSGFYCDQRDNRAAVAALARGRKMLDLFCYSGGFSLSAARAGATHAVGVDSSGAALELARRNAELNDVGSITSFVQADCVKYLENGEMLDRDPRTSERMVANGGAPRDFDIVICDPPKFAPTVKDLERASRKYRKLNGLAMRALRPGGLLVTCTCSAAMSQSGTFLKTVHEAAEIEGRSLTLLSESGAARDHVLHPAVMESRYLTCLMFVVD